MNDYAKRLEPNLGNFLSIEMQAVVSIAISLKRIADMMEQPKTDTFKPKYSFDRGS